MEISEVLEESEQEFKVMNSVTIALSTTDLHSRQYTREDQIWTQEYTRLSFDHDNEA
jgi:hypothetical protein